MISQGVMVRAGADGCVDTGPIVLDGCCPPTLCGPDVCNLICSFINLLPQGPMWDYWKAKALAYYEERGKTTVCDTLCLPDLSCPSVVMHAIYAAFKLQFLLTDVLWPSLRERDPFTAETTLDDWLVSYAWEDCYNQNCRSVLLADSTPFEVMGECGPVLCGVTVPDALACAVKRGIVLSLSRANMGIIKNLCAVNWIIEPLGAVVQPNNIEQCENIDCDCDGALRKCLEWRITNVGMTLPACTMTSNPCDVVAGEVVQAFVEHSICDPAGLPAMTFPGVIAAECIVRSLLPSACPNKLVRSCSIEGAPPSALLLLSGDQQSGNDVLQYSGDQYPAVEGFN